MSITREDARKDLLEGSPFEADGGEKIGRETPGRCLCRFCPAIIKQKIL